MLSARRPKTGNGQSRVAAFLQGLQEVGWVVGRNVSIDVRWAAAEVETMKRAARELAVWPLPALAQQSANLGLGRSDRSSSPPARVYQTGGPDRTQRLSPRAERGNARR